MRTTSLLLFLLSLSASTPALAEPSSHGAAAQAEQLFEQGLEAMRRQDYGSACPKLAESYQLDASPGALFTLAECEASWQKSASALAHYQSFLSALTAMPAERRDTFEERRRIASNQIAALSVSAPELTIDVAPGQPPALLVRAGTTVVPPAAYGVARRLDPGVFTVTAELEGKKVWERTIELESGSKASVEVEPSSGGEAFTPSSPAFTPSSPALPPGRTGARKPVGFYVAGSIAAGGIATGLVAGLLAYEKKNDVDAHCPERTCDAQGRAALNAARSEARVSTVAASFGIAGVAAAAMFLVFARHEGARSSQPAASSERRWGITSDGRSVAFVRAFQ
jgi:hypothetical protein